MKKTGLYRFTQVVVPPLFRLLYRCRIYGRENVPQSGSVLMCSNHTSNTDPIFLGMTQKRQVWYMAKKELFKNRFIAWILTGLGAFPVERSGGVSAIRRGLDILRKDGVVGIFIEGTRSKTGELLKPKPGVTMLAYETKSPIVPVAIIGADGKKPKVFHKVIVNIGKPIPFEELGMEEASGLSMRNASRTVMEQIRLLREEALH